MTEKHRWIECYLNTLALYCVLKEPSITRIRRAELKQGEVRAESIDFMLDVEIRASKALQDPFSEDLWENILDDPLSYETLPEPVQATLGRAFLENDLGTEGAYRTLYFKIRNEQVRKYGSPSTARNNISS